MNICSLTSYRLETPCSLTQIIAKPDTVSHNSLWEVLRNTLDVVALDGQPLYRRESICQQVLAFDLVPERGAVDGNLAASGVTDADKFLLEKFMCPGRGGHRHVEGRDWVTPRCCGWLGIEVGGRFGGVTRAQGSISDRTSRASPPCVSPGPGAPWSGSAGGRMPLARRRPGSSETIGRRRCPSADNVSDAPSPTRGDSRSRVPV